MVQIKKLREFNIYENPKPAARSRQAIFPGAVRLSRTELLIMLTIGEAFESADARTYISRSTDNGNTWKLENQLYDQEALGLDCQRSEHYKPTILENGNLIAFGYGFVRRDPEKGLGPDDNNGDFPPGFNAVTFSTDKGYTWTIPKQLDLGSKVVLETSGPCVQAASGALLAAGPPFTTAPGAQEGWLIASEDGGQNWHKRSTFFRSADGNLAPWETRLIEMQPGKLVAISWVYDVVHNKHLPNHIVVSYDEGRSWASIINTECQDQASNLLYIGDDKLLTIHTHREGRTGLLVRVTDFTNDQWRPLEEVAIWGEAASQETECSITQQFIQMKLGQPSLVALGENKYLAIHWCVEDCMYKIKAHQLHITL